MAELTFRYGAMNSGKSTALMQTAFNYEEQGLRVLVLKPGVDTKGGEMLVSRLGIRRPVDVCVSPDMDVYHIIEESSRREEPLACVLTDESQFFTPQQAEQLFWAAVRLDIPVIAYGLRTDFRTQGFPGASRLLELAHRLEELKTICPCGQEARFNARKVGGSFVFEGSQIAIDGSEASYQSLCPKCYFREKEAFFKKQR